MHWLLFMFGSLVLFVDLAAQQSVDLDKRFAVGEVGLPFMQNYLPEDYEADHQNFCGLQSIDGLIYIGNADGLLVYDGEEWRLITLQNSSLISALDEDDQGQIFYGSYNDFGQVAPNAAGQLGFESLAHLVDTSNQRFGEIWDVTIIGEEVFFRSASHCFRFAQGEVRSWSAKEFFTCSFEHDEDYYLQDSRLGIGTVAGQKIRWIKSADHLEGAEFRSIVPLEEGGWLGLTAREGLMRIHEHGVERFATPADSLLRTTVSLHMLQMRNGWNAICTTTGLLVLNGEGQVIQFLTAQQGLTGNYALTSFQDRQSALWVAHSSGISRVEVVSPFSLYDERNGVEGYVDMIHRHAGELYAAGQLGLSMLSISKGRLGLPELHSLEGSNNHALYLMTHDDQLFAAARDGVFTIAHDRLHNINRYQAGALLTSKRDSNLIYVGYRGALGLMRSVAGEWKLVDVIEEIKDDNRQMIEDNQGRLWIEPQDGGIWMVEFTELKKDTFSDYQYRYFETGKDLPPGSVFLFEYEGGALFAVNGIVYQYSDDQDSIVPNHDFGRKFGFEGAVSPKLLADPKNRWIKAQVGETQRKELFFVKELDDGSTQVEFVDTRRIIQSVSKALLPDQDSILWHGGRDGIVRQDLKIPVNHDPHPKVLIREVTIDGDSTVFLGTGARSLNHTLAFGHDYRFRFSLPSFDHEDYNLYQYYLEGFDRDWSGWTSESQKDYTRIPHGDFIFRARGKNIYDQISEEDYFLFTVLPPWYHTWWAYLGYLILGLLGANGLVRWRSNQLRKEKLALQHIVNARTSELQVRNEQLMVQKRQLSQQAAELRQVDKLKSRLLANISHEFRTPLTLIKGPLDQLERYPKSELSAKNARMMLRNANRLLRLVNQLLDLSRLDAGVLPLNLSEGNIFMCLRAAGSAFSSHAAQRNLDYQIQIPAVNLWASFDRDKIEEVVYNLLSNAFKFTPDEGSILFRAEHSNGMLNLEVTDSGHGIPSAHQENIFQRFYQVDSSSTKSSEGSGIGLSLVKEFVDLMKGKITLESELGQGTSFFIKIPMPVIEKGQPSIDLIKSIRENLPLRQMGVASEKESTTSSKVLIVEDNPDMREYITQQMAPMYQVLLAANGPEGLKLVRQEVPDLVITDVMMPEMDGMQLCDLIKSDPKTSHIPVIMLTAKAGIEHKISGLDLGADAYITKPFNAEELAVTVKNLLDQRAKLREIFSNKIDQFDPKAISWPSLDQEFIQQVLQLLEKKYGIADFGVPAMQKELAMSKTQLHRKMKALTNQPPGEFLRNFRLKRAAQILETGENVTQTAYAVGFNNLSYFAKCFKDLHGVSPKEYQSKANF